MDKTTIKTFDFTLTPIFKNQSRRFSFEILEILNTTMIFCTEKIAIDRIVTNFLVTLIQIQKMKIQAKPTIRICGPKNHNMAESGSPFFSVAISFNLNLT